MRKKTFAAVVALSGLLVMAGSASAQLQLPRPSPKSTVSQTVGVTDVTVIYSRPSVRDRKIWGALVPMDQVWRTGANEATIVKFSSDVKINGNALAGGTYSLHTIPGEKEWTVIFNKVADQWGSYSYDAAKDALRVKAKPEASSHHEMLTFEFPAVTPTSADMVIAWEKVRVPLKIEVDTVTHAQKAVREAMSTAKADDARTPFQSANYYFENNLDPAYAMELVNKAIAIRETYGNLTLKARMLAKAGKKKEAIATAERAVAVGKAAEPKVDTATAEKLIAEWKAMK